MKKFFALPTYYLYWITKPYLPEHHPWKNKEISLKDWENNRTKLAVFIDVNLWLYIVFVVSILVYLIK